jgi:hypothetical protein
MKIVITFLLSFLLILTGVAAYMLSGAASAWLQTRHVWIFSLLFGGLGGVLYCLRGVYLNACVRKQWDEGWMPWYFIRPFASVICGGISCLVLKAGLLLLEANPHPQSTELGFYAFAVVAGLNVDKFVSKVEDIAQATWGIEKSKTAKSADTRSPKDNV